MGTAVLAAVHSDYFTSHYLTDSRIAHLLQQYLADCEAISRPLAPERINSVLIVHPTYVRERKVQWTGACYQSSTTLIELPGKRRLASLEGIRHGVLGYALRKHDDGLLPVVAAYYGTIRGPRFVGRIDDPEEMLQVAREGLGIRRMDVHEWKYCPLGYRGPDCVTARNI